MTAPAIRDLLMCLDRPEPKHVRESKLHVLRFNEEVRQLYALISEQIHSVDRDSELYVRQTRIVSTDYQTGRTFNTKQLDISNLCRLDRSLAIKPVTLGLVSVLYRSAGAVVETRINLDESGVWHATTAYGTPVAAVPHIQHYLDKLLN